MMQACQVATQRGTVLDGVLFQSEKKADTVVIAITGIHGNFYSNPFYYHIGHTLNGNGIDFLYAQTNDAFSRIRTHNVVTGQAETIGSWNERFADTDEDIDAYIDHAEHIGYQHIILAGHSLGANKVIHYLSSHHTPRVSHFILLSPASLPLMMSTVTDAQKAFIRRQVHEGRGGDMLPFPFMGWVDCTADTAWDWLYSGLLDNVSADPDADFSQCRQIVHTGALLIGTYDTFTDGNPIRFLQNINSQMPTAAQNRLVFIEGTGHTYQKKHQELADSILQLVHAWQD